MSWLLRHLALWTSPSTGGDLDVKALGVGGVNVSRAQRRVIVGIAGGDGTDARICAMPPWAARQLAFDLWAAAAQCDRALQVH